MTAMNGRNGGICTSDLLGTSCSQTRRAADCATSRWCLELLSHQRLPGFNRALDSRAAETCFGCTGRARTCAPLLNTTAPNFRRPSLVRCFSALPRPTRRGETPTSLLAKPPKSTALRDHPSKVGSSNVNRQVLYLLSYRARDWRLRQDSCPLLDRSKAKWTRVHVAARIQPEERRRRLTCILLVRSQVLVHRAAKTCFCFFCQRRRGRWIPNACATARTAVLASRKGKGRPQLVQATSGAREFATKCYTDHRNGSIDGAQTFKTIRFECAKE